MIIVTFELCLLQLRVNCGTKTWRRGWGGPRWDATAPCWPQLIHLPLLLQFRKNIPAVLSQKRWEPPTARGEGLSGPRWRSEALQNRSCHWNETLKYMCFPPDGATAADRGNLLDVRLLMPLQVFNQTIVFLFSNDNTLLPCKLAIVYVVPVNAKVNAAKDGQIME